MICIEDGKPVQYGIASYTLKCGQTGFPGIYVPVSRYIDWMDEIIPEPTTSTTTTSTTTTTTEEPTTTTVNQARVPLSDAISAILLIF